MGAALNYAGRPQEAIPFFKKSLRLSPIPYSSVTLILLGAEYRQLGQYEEAVASYKRALELFGADDLLAHVHLAGTYALMGREKEAHAEAAEALRIDPAYSAESFVRRSQYQYKDQKGIDAFASALRKAGLK